MWAASSSAGGRVCGVISSSWSRGPMVSASRTSSQPVGVRQVVIITFVPATYVRATGCVIPNGARRLLPAWRPRSLPDKLGESKDGTHSQQLAPSVAISAPVWQLERKPYSAIGGNGDGAA